MPSLSLVRFADSCHKRPASHLEIASEDIMLAKNLAQQSDNRITENAIDRDDAAPEKRWRLIAIAEC